jgi:hypothetical protein
VNPLPLALTPEDEQTLAALRRKLYHHDPRHPAIGALDRLQADHRAILKENVELLKERLARETE